jgi:signal transduction histidine kinase
MFTLSSILLQTLKLISDTASSLKVKPDSFLSLSNPLISTSLILVCVLTAIFVFYNYAFLPMSRRFQVEKEELRSKDTKLMAAFADFDPEPIFRFDQNGTIVMVNNAGLKLDKSAELTGQTLNSLMPEVVKFDLAKCIQNGEQIYFTSFIKGKWFRFTMKGMPELGIGQIYGSDITELKETEAKLITALKKAEESEKIKTFFLAQISHEIRSPLTAIMGYNSLIKEDIAGKINKELEYAFDAIDYSSKRLKRTIDQILNMSLLQTGKYELRFESIEVAPIIQDIIAEYKNDSRQRHLDLNYSNTADNTFVHADRYSMIQVFSNIIDNAIKYTKKGGVNINLERDSLNKLSVVVSDTGIGMSEDYVKNLFVPFTQEAMGYDRPYEGSGLGMALIKRFCDLNKVKLQIQSEKNKGTSLQITFNNVELHA